MYQLPKCTQLADTASRQFPGPLKALWGPWVKESYLGRISPLETSTDLLLLNPSILTAVLTMYEAMQMSQISLQ